VAAVLGVGLYLTWRRKDHVGYLAEWTIVLAGSAIAAPMIGEIGTPAGSISTGAGSTSATAIIAWTLLGIVVVLATAALVWVSRRREAALT
jgi:cation transporter-like permease